MSEIEPCNTADKTNCPKFSILTNTNLLSYISRGHMSDRGPIGLKSRLSRSAFLSGSSSGEFLALPFPASKDCLLSWLRAPSLQLQSQQKQVVASLSPPHLPPSYALKGPCNNIAHLCNLGCSVYWKVS